MSCFLLYLHSFKIIYRHIGDEVILMDLLSTDLSIFIILLCIEDPTI